MQLYLKDIHEASWLDEEQKYQASGEIEYNHDFLGADIFHTVHWKW